MKELLPLLHKFSDHHPSQEVRDMATDIRIAIATHGVVMSDALAAAAAHRIQQGTTQPSTEHTKTHIGANIKSTDNVTTKPLIQVLHTQPENSKTNKMNENRENEAKETTKTNDKEEKVKDGASIATKEGLELALEELCDPLIPVRGHGLIRLRRLIESGDRASLDRWDMVMKVFSENLDHPDSYIYLAAIQGLASLAHTQPTKVLTAVCQQYTQQSRSPELTMKIGQVMVKTCTSLGKLSTFAGKTII